MKKSFARVAAYMTNHPKLVIAFPGHLLLGGPLRKKKRSLWSGALRIGLSLVILFSSTGFMPAASIFAAADGVQLLSKLTRPNGGVWLDNATGGGHWWQPDQVLGFCRVDAAATGGYSLNACNLSAKSAAQAVAEPFVSTTPTKKRFVYVADNSNVANVVVRFTFDPVTETVSSPLSIQAPNTPDPKTNNLTPGQVTSVALSPDNKDLYVGYIKSGDITKIPAVNTLTTSFPQVVKAGITTDGRGTTGGLALFAYNDSAGLKHFDLYIGEIGGFGMSVIKDFTGTQTQSGCGSGGAACQAVTVKDSKGAVVSSFPSGLVADQTYLYFGNSPLVDNAVVNRYNPATGTVEFYSQNVPPYTWTADFTNQITQSQYKGITGLGLAPNGDLYVAADPTFGLAAPPLQQGFLWLVPPVPTVSLISPNSGPTAGGTTVTITGQNLTSTTGLPTMISFGGTSATNVNCTNRTTCTATTPPGAGPVNVVVKVGPQATTPGTTSIFNYTGPAPQNLPVITAVSPNTGSTAGGETVTITGTNLSSTSTSTVNFGPGNPGSNASCSLTSCTVTAPPGSGQVDIQVTVNGLTSATVAADKYNYQGAVVPTITQVSPAAGPGSGGTIVTITGTGFSTTPTSIKFGNSDGTGIICASATSCQVTSPPGAGLVDITLNVAGQASQASPVDKFSYVTANLYAWGLTAPKGGVIYLPGDLGGHIWAADHVQGFCRLDQVNNTKVWAYNLNNCDPGLTVGSPGQPTYDPRTNPDGTHYVYIPDNAVKSLGVARVTFDPKTETISNPEILAPGLIINLKPNGTALGPDGSLYVGDLIDGFIRRIRNPNGDPRNMTVDIVGITGDGRGINGTIGFLSNELYLSENRGATHLDVTTCPTSSGPCHTTPIPLVPAGVTVPVFVSGVTTDQGCGGNSLPACLAGQTPRPPSVYISNSPGGGDATIFRYYPATPTVPASIFLKQGLIPASGTPEATVWCALSCSRPWDASLVPGAVTAFHFANGLFVDQRDGTLYISDDPTAGVRGLRGHLYVVSYINS